MAEWAILIFIVVVVGVAYTIGRFLYEPRQTIVLWVIAAVLITVGLGFYASSKVSNFEEGFNDRYKTTEGP